MIDWFFNLSTLQQIVTIALLVIWLPAGYLGIRLMRSIEEREVGPPCALCSTEKPHNYHWFYCYLGLFILFIAGLILGLMWLKWLIYGQNQPLQRQTDQ